ncbi:MAG: CRTAC1 family protein [Planctomycetales bacterium]|nr:CRTAC1 family protein [Planctomycetales bacterium]
MHHSHCILALVIVASLCACKRSNDPKQATQIELFVDVTADSGIDFVHVAAEQQNEFFMPRAIGSGAAFLDYDGDGQLDVYCLQNGGPDSHSVNRLYRQVDGKFTDVSPGSGLDLDGYGMGVAVGDINNDGKSDVVVTEYGQTRLLVNESVDAQPRFRDVSNSAGIENALWGTSTCFFDYDRDGWLDLLIVNYVSYDPTRWCAGRGATQEFCGPDAFPGQASRLYHNLGDIDGDEKGDAKFEDVTARSGFAKHEGPGLGVFCGDFDGDRWPDVFVAHDGQPNHLWINQTDGTFKEEAITRGLAYNSMGDSEADMGIGIGDVNGNGLFDVFVTHLTTETHTLWSQGPKGIFTDKTATSGIAKTKWRGTGFGTVLADLDNDGDLDMALANGRVRRISGETSAVRPGLSEFWTQYAERDQIVLNDGTGKFTDASEENPAVSKPAGVARGLACADFNNDGSLDLLITNIAGPPVLLQNTKANAGNWVLVKATDPQTNRDAIGAEVYLTAGGTTLMRWVNPGYSFLCSNDPRAHFGLGKLTTYDAIQVVWPDGAIESFSGGAANRQITLEKGTGQPAKISQ